MLIRGLTLFTQNEIIQPLAQLVAYFPKNFQTRFVVADACGRRVGKTLVNALRTAWKNWASVFSIIANGNNEIEISSGEFLD
jgi:hypothetical protein